MIDIMRREKDEQTNEIQTLSDANELSLIDLQKSSKELELYEKENEEIVAENEKMQENIKELKAEIEKATQKMQLADLLKDVDIEELKMLKQNNMSVNSAIVNLVKKWESIEPKL